MIEKYDCAENVPMSATELNKIRLNNSKAEAYLILIIK